MKYVTLWLIWLAWGLLLIGYAMPGWREFSQHSWVHYGTATLFVFVLISVLFLVKGKLLIMFKKKGKYADAVAACLPASTEVITPESAALLAPLAKTIITEQPKPAVSSIAVDCRVTGELTVEGEIHISGIVDGNIYCDQQVKVLKSGCVKGDIRAKIIVIDGSVEGCCCGETIEILEHGRVKGVVQSDNFSINKKGRFIGHAEPWASVDLPAIKQEKKHRYDKVLSGV